VWIFGGGFEEGGSTDWDPVNITSFGSASNLPTVIVTLNYRLSGLGFAALPELANVTGNGNFGLLDQRLALKWVQSNIERFGGDPSKVSIWGQSAGAQSVCFHLLSPGSRDLFRGAVSSSGPCILPYPTIADAEAQGNEWASRVGCRGPPGPARLACLRSASLSALHAAGSPRLSPRDGFLYPAIDGTNEVWPLSNAELMHRGKLNSESVLFGSTGNDLGGGYSKHIPNASPEAYPRCVVVCFVFATLVVHMTAPPSNHSPTAYCYPSRAHNTCHRPHACAQNSICRHRLTRE
jgi:para-nitrobenzyl esterase